MLLTIALCTFVEFPVITMLTSIIGLLQAINAWFTVTNEFNQLGEAAQSGDEDGSVSYKTFFQNVTSFQAIIFNFLCITAMCFMNAIAAAVLS